MRSLRLTALITVNAVVDGVARLLRARDDGLAGGLRALGERVARIAGAGADITVTERLAGGVEIRLRMVSGCVAGGEAEHGGERDNQGEFVVHHELNMRS